MIRLSSVGSRTLLFCAGIAITNLASAQTTAADIASAILGQGGLPLVEVDINADGIVDARDLACFHSNCNPVSIEFSQGTSEVSEDDGLIQLPLRLSRSAFCTLNYTIEGPATAGSDYLAPSGSIMLAGSNASIPITILDDTNFDEELEPLIVAIAPGTCYRPGSQSVQYVHLVDNDRPWFGTIEAQILGSNPAEGSGDLLGFRLDVVRGNGAVTATLIADGGMLPPGMWPADVFIEGPNNFSMVLAPIPAATTSTSFEAALNRQFSFAASNSNPDQEVQPGVARGTYTETITSALPATGYLETVVVGRFSLVRSAPRPSSWQPPLDPSP
ncbi:MAG: Calx-beta domain-containing protein [Lysobacterales bacterium]